MKRLSGLSGRSEAGLFCNPNNPAGLAATGAVLDGGRCKALGAVRQRTSASAILCRTARAIAPFRF
jgi:hypothetical protein